MENKKLIQEVPDADSKVLAVHIIAYRVIGINKELSIACMEELAKRRSNGDSFNYEEYIESKIKDFPRFKNMDMVNVTNNINTQVRGMNGKNTIKFNNKKNNI